MKRRTSQVFGCFVNPVSYIILLVGADNIVNPTKYLNKLCQAERKEKATRWPRTSVKNVWERIVIRRNKFFLKIAWMRILSREDDYSGTRLPANQPLRRILVNRGCFVAIADFKALSDFADNKSVRLWQELQTDDGPAIPYEALPGHAHLLDHLQY